MSLTDPFGNPLDAVGYARGSILSSSISEAMKLQHAQVLAGRRVREHGPESIAIFTGNQRDFRLKEADLNTLAEEWVGPSLFQEQLREAAVNQLGGTAATAVTVLNRTSAGIVSAILAFAREGSVLSVVPRGGRSHASVTRGSWLARAELLEIESNGNWGETQLPSDHSLVIVTTVTSSLERLSDEDIEVVVNHFTKLEIPVLLDEAYGARLRPVLHQGRQSLGFGAGLVITNCDKAGMPGPRAGILAGEASLVLRVQAAASELGMEARAPIAAAAMRALAEYSAADLVTEAEMGAQLSDALENSLPVSVVRSDLGPMIHENDIHRIVCERGGIDPNLTELVPAETATAVGMVLLKDHGILTVNTHGQPGARVSFRLKPTLEAISRAGGVHKVILAVIESIDVVAESVADIAQIRTIILGEQQ